MKAVLTGGHATPALAVIELAKNADWEIFWIGEKRAVSQSDVATLEARIIPKLGIPFFAITTAKLKRPVSLFGILSLWKFFLGFFQSLFLLIKIRPNVVLSFGSYISVPIAFAAWILRIPIVVHEQTATSGLANRIVAKLAKKVAISFPGTQNNFPKEKVVFTGNPIRRGIFQIAKKRKIQRGNPPILYITGGSRGSQAINKAVCEILPRLLDTFVVYHQTGELDFKKMNDTKKRLVKTQGARYHIAPNYTPGQVERIYKTVDIAVSRAGANTVFELAVLGIPAILIPLPYASANEQEKNAQVLASFGTAVIIPQDKLSGKLLYKTIWEMLETLPRYRRKAQFARRLAKEDAALRLFKLVEHEAS